MTFTTQALQQFLQEPNADRVQALHSGAVDNNFRFRRHSERIKLPLECAYSQRGPIT
jgi:hypothetical protein